MNKYNLTNKVAIVTGGAQGFGLAITKRIIQSGGKVVIWDIDKEEAKKAKKEINSENFSYQIVNVTDFEIIKKSITEIEKKFGQKPRNSSPSVRVLYLNRLGAVE